MIGGPSQSPRMQAGPAREESPRLEAWQQLRASRSQPRIFGAGGGSTHTSNVQSSLEMGGSPLPAVPSSRAGMGKRKAVLGDRSRDGLCRRVDLGSGANAAPSQPCTTLTSLPWSCVGTVLHALPQNLLSSNSYPRRCHYSEAQRGQATYPRSPS